MTKSGQITLFLKLKNTSNPDEIKRIQSLLQIIPSELTSPVIKDSYLVIISNMTKDTNVTKIKAKFEVSAPIWSYINKALISFYMEPTPTELYRVDSSPLYPDGRICAQPWTVPIDDVSFSGDCDANFKNQHYSKGSYKIWIEAKNISFEQKVSFCGAFYLNSDCSMTLMPTITFSHNDKDGTIKLHEDGSLYQYSNYVPLEKGIGICKSASNVSKLRIFTNLVHYLDLQ